MKCAAVRRHTGQLPLVCACLLSCCSSVHADPADYREMPHALAGELSDMALQAKRAAERT